MSISGVTSQISNLQAIRAQQAFQKAAKLKTNESEQDDLSFESVEKPKATELPRQFQYKIDEIKNYVDKSNIKDVEVDDIQYALKYGTSLFADYSA